MGASALVCNRHYIMCAWWRLRESAHMQMIGGGERAFPLRFRGESEEVRAATISITVGRN